ncbi:hypothetical protein [Dokdonia sp.]|uniref:hypothetical protein n=1 Tax=Dokdonia sp. TaxID=2024995 RepID=UPI0032675422
MKYFISRLFIYLSVVSIQAQNSEGIEKHSFSVSNLSDVAFKDFIQPQIQESQFIFFGEQHGIIEVGQATHVLYDMARPFGYHTLCIETDAIAAKTITSFFDTEDAVKTAQQLNIKYPFSIPFYANEEDFKMFENVLRSGGTLWGIDQTLMTQFRLNFDYMITHTKSEAFKSKLIPLKEKAMTAFEKTIAEKDFMAPYIFKYDTQTHQDLIAVATMAEEKEVLENFKNTKEIYEYNFRGQYYLNNEVRARLMKRNFMKYYKEAQKVEPTPKVLFKLGGNHAARGLTRTKVYDIANLGSELAITNGMESLHILCMGISGTQNVANPFEPEKAVQPIDASKTLPKEFIDLAITTAHKYQIINTKALRPEARTFSEEVRDIIFKYDVIILVKDAKALTSF